MLVRIAYEEDPDQTSSALFVSVVDPEGFRGFARTPLKGKIISFSWRIFKKIRKINEKSGKVNK